MMTSPAKPSDPGDPRVDPPRQPRPATPAKYAKAAYIITLTCGHTQVVPLSKRDGEWGRCRLSCVIGPPLVKPYVRPRPVYPRRRW